MTEDKEFLARKELSDLGHILVCEGRNGVALFSFGFALEQDAGSGFKAGKHCVWSPVIVSSLT